MSASTTPTSAPPAASAAARLTESVDLPTPPLPEAKATTRVRWLSEIDFCSPPFPPGWRRWRRAVFSCALITSKETPTEETPSTDPTWCRTWPSRSAFIGQPATVRAIVTSTWSPRTSTPRTMSSSTTLRRISGSMTARSASRIDCSAIMPRSLGGTGLAAVHELAQPAAPRLVARGDRTGAALQPEVERLQIPRHEGRAGLPHDQRGRRQVDRPARLQRRHPVDAAVRELAQRQRERPEHADAPDVPVEPRCGVGHEAGVGRLEIH